MTKQARLRCCSTDTNSTILTDCTRFKLHTCLRYFIFLLRSLILSLTFMIMLCLLSLQFYSSHMTKITAPYSLPIYTSSIKKFDVLLRRAKTCTLKIIGQVQRMLLITDLHSDYASTELYIQTRYFKKKRILRVVYQDSVFQETKSPCFGLF